MAKARGFTATLGKDLSAVPDVVLSEADTVSPITPLDEKKLAAAVVATLNLPMAKARGF